MRLLVLSVTVVGLMCSKLGHADPYRWCANYGSGQGGGGSNCYFMTLEQCKAAISGNGGFCDPNTFYDGRPVTAPGNRVPTAVKRKAR
jgi:hypothetical protein